MRWAFTVSGAPRTKKTHNVLARAGRQQRGRAIVLPSKVWERWAKTCAFGFESEQDLRDWYANGPLLTEVNCRALFYCDAARGDAVGYYQGLADLLEKRGIVANDKQLVSWDGSRLLKDTKNPRVEVLLTWAPGPFGAAPAAL